MKTGRKRGQCVLFSDSRYIRRRESGVYAIIHRDSGRVYVGGSTNLQQRFNRYRSELNVGKDLRRINEAIRQSPESFEFSVVEWESDIKELRSKEQFWINFYRSHDPDFGYNACPSTASCTGLKHSQATINAKIERQKGRSPVWMHTAAVREKMSQAKKGIKLPAETIRKSIEARRLKKINWKPVVQMDELGNEIARFERMKDAAKALGNESEKSNISAVCRGLRLKAAGYGWKYA